MKLSIPERAVCHAPNLLERFPHYGDRLWIDRANEASLLHDEILANKSIPMFSFIRTPVGFNWKKYLNRDGLHLSPAGKVAYIDFVRPLVRSFSFNEHEFPMLQEKPFDPFFIQEPIPDHFRKVRVQRPCYILALHPMLPIYHSQDSNERDRPSFCTVQSSKSNKAFSTANRKRNKKKAKFKKRAKWRDYVFESPNPIPFLAKETPPRKPKMKRPKEPKVPTEKPKIPKVPKVPKRKEKE